MAMLRTSYCPRRQHCRCQLRKTEGGELPPVGNLRRLVFLSLAASVDHCIADVNTLNSILIDRKQHAFCGVESFSTLR
jgi:hypothetical protein